MIDFKSLLAIQHTRKEANSVGARNSGRETVHSDGSLLLHGVTQEDSGLYTPQIVRTDMQPEEAQVWSFEELSQRQNEHVTQPFVQITDATIVGRRSVIFTCISPDTDIPIHWLFNKENLQLKERMTLSPKKCGLRINPVRSEDAGEYQCEVSNGFNLKISLPVSWL
ncbi:carcinoembryonic antigen-related cell adhesion molecule 3-like [Mesocricetus auratus]|uniref:Carcinoembryonic antigen-related cell adhesion molecule 3-like n=1 Tax=Mesocricetus auratus TaxID=10036 RepID=A0A1U8CN47_MESAU|nr:carcinoembryonic antigen-related cell adhesion molecule 3-like [Mesocricetus auratus]